MSYAMGSEERYNYLNLENSRIYDFVKDSQDVKDRIIKRLILELAGQLRAEHCRSTY